jgi:DNA-binding MarR family transcriptional regulator
MNKAPRDRNAVLEGLELLRDRDAGLLLNSVIAFLYVAENEGIAVKDLAYLCRLNEATTSRAVRALTAPGARGALLPSLSLVVLVQNPQDARSRLIYLTDEGRVVRREIDAAITRGVTMAADQFDARHEHTTS